MFSTVLLAATFIGLLLASTVLWALLLRIGVRWAKVPNATTRRVIVATGVVTLLRFVMRVLFFSVSPSNGAQEIALECVEFAAAIVVPCAVISVVFQARFLRAFQAWLPTLLATVATLAFTLLVLRPFLFEAYSIPTNAMAPTVIGKHWRGTCPECGEPNYCSPRDARYIALELPRMICRNFHVTKAEHVSKLVHSGDRIVAAKFLTPKRWDLIVFQDPENPASQYVKRLVGLPGETIHIQDGAVWANGQKLTLPDSLRGLEYLVELPDSVGPELWGSPTRPASLDKDEYFVLGDFSAQSKDSRFWETGAPGHSPFAVPATYIKGVVTHTYWPTDRWRVHR